MPISYTKVGIALFKKKFIYYFFPILIPNYRFFHNTHSAEKN